MLADRLARASSSLDLQTGGAEVYAAALARAARQPAAVAATESWAPNLAQASSTGASCVRMSASTG